MSNDSLFMVQTFQRGSAILFSGGKPNGFNENRQIYCGSSKENGLTQEQLGERIGVTNKTVSRWETGVYLPPADMLLALGELFHVNVNEILSGKRLTDAEYKKAAEENLTQAIKASSFSLKDKIEFFKKKWLKEHIAIMVVIGICIIAVLIVGILIKNLVLISITPILILAAHAWRNNTMMAYVERKVYDENGN